VTKMNEGDLSDKIAAHQPTGSYSEKSDASCQSSGVLICLGLETKTVKPRLHQIHVAGYKLVSRTSNLYPSTCRRIQVLSSVLLADTSGYM